jgi:hypothetical protein
MTTGTTSRAYHGPVAIVTVTDAKRLLPLSAAAPTWPTSPRSCAPRSAPTLNGGSRSDDR